MKLTVLVEKLELSIGLDLQSSAGGGDRLVDHSLRAVGQRSVCQTSGRESGQDRHHNTGLLLVGRSAWSTIFQAPIGLRNRLVFARGTIVLLLVRNVVLIAHLSRRSNGHTQANKTECLNSSLSKLQAVCQRLLQSKRLWRFFEHHTRNCRWE